MAEPQALIAAMAKADAASQKKIASSMAYSDAYGAEKVDIVQLLTELKLPNNATAEEKAAPDMVIGYVENTKMRRFPAPAPPSPLAWG